MTTTAYAGLDGHLNFNIPKVKRKLTKDNLTRIELTSRDAQEILSSVERSYLGPAYTGTWTVDAVDTVVNKQLQEAYRGKKLELKDEGRHTKDLTDQYMFMACKDPFLSYSIAKNGLQAEEKKDKILNALGNSKSGVSLWKHADVQLSFAETYPLITICKLIVFKVMMGKVKSVQPCYGSDTGVEPTPNYDCHISAVGARSEDPFYPKLMKSQVFFYEYTDDALPAACPRQCLPYAILTYKRPKESAPVDHTLKSAYKNTFRPGRGRGDPGALSAEEMGSNVNVPGRPSYQSRPMLIHPRQGAGDTDLRLGTSTTPSPPVRATSQPLLPNPLVSQQLGRPHDNAPPWTSDQQFQPHSLEPAAPYKRTLLQTPDLPPHRLREDPRVARRLSQTLIPDRTEQSYQVSDGSFVMGNPSTVGPVSTGSNMEQVSGAVSCQPVANMQKDNGMTGPVVHPCVTGPVVHPCVTGPVVHPCVTGPVVHPCVTGPVVHPCVTGPVVHPCVTGPVVHPCVTGPVVHPCANGFTSAEQRLALNPAVGSGPNGAPEGSPSQGNVSSPLKQVDMSKVQQSLTDSHVAMLKQALTASQCAPSTPAAPPLHPPQQKLGEGLMSPSPSCVNNVQGATQQAVTVQKPKTGKQKLSLESYRLMKRKAALGQPQPQLPGQCNSNADQTVADKPAPTQEPQATVSTENSNGEPQPSAVVSLKPPEIESDDSTAPKKGILKTTTPSQQDTGPDENMGSTTVAEERSDDHPVENCSLPSLAPGSPCSIVSVSSVETSSLSSSVPGSTAHSPAQADHKPPGKKKRKVNRMMMGYKKRRKRKGGKRKVGSRSLVEEEDVEEQPIDSAGDSSTTKDSPSSCCSLSGISKSGSGTTKDSPSSCSSISGTSKIGSLLGDSVTDYSDVALEQPHDMAVSAPHGWTSPRLETFGIRHWSEAATDPRFQPRVILIRTKMDLLCDATTEPEEDSSEVIECPESPDSPVLVIDLTSDTSNAGNVEEELTADVDQRRDLVDTTSHASAIDLTVSDSSSMETVVMDKAVTAMEDDYTDSLMTFSLTMDREAPEISSAETLGKEPAVQEDQERGATSKLAEGVYDSSHEQPHLKELRCSSNGTSLVKSNQGKPAVEDSASKTSGGRASVVSSNMCDVSEIAEVIDRDMRKSQDTILYPKWPGIKQPIKESKEVSTANSPSRNSMRSEPLQTAQQLLYECGKEVSMDIIHKVAANILPYMAGHSDSAPGMTISEITSTIADILSPVNLPQTSSSTLTAPATGDKLDDIPLNPDDPHQPYPCVPPVSRHSSSGLSPYDQAPLASRCSSVGLSPYDQAPQVSRDSSVGLSSYDHPPLVSRHSSVGLSSYDQAPQVSRDSSVGLASYDQAPQVFRDSSVGLSSYDQPSLSRGNSVVLSSYDQPQRVSRDTSAGLSFYDQQPLPRDNSVGLSSYDQSPLVSRDNSVGMSAYDQAHVPLVSGDSTVGISSYDQLQQVSRDNYTVGMSSYEQVPPAFRDNTVPLSSHHVSQVYSDNAIGLPCHSHSLQGSAFGNGTPHCPVSQGLDAAVPLYTPLPQVLQDRQNSAVGLPSYSAVAHVAQDSPEHLHDCQVPKAPQPSPLPSKSPEPEYDPTEATLAILHEDSDEEFVVKPSPEPEYDPTAATLAILHEDSDEEFMVKPSPEPENGSTAAALAILHDDSDEELMFKPTVLPPPKQGETSRIPTDGLYSAYMPQIGTRTTAPESAEQTAAKWLGQMAQLCNVKKDEPENTSLDMFESVRKTLNLDISLLVENSPQPIVEEVEVSEPVDVVTPAEQLSADPLPEKEEQVESLPKSGETVAEDSKETSKIESLVSEPKKNKSKLDKSIPVLSRRSGHRTGRLSKETHINKKQVVLLTSQTAVHGNNSDIASPVSITTVEETPSKVLETVQTTPSSPDVDHGQTDILCWFEDMLHPKRDETSVLTHETLGDGQAAGGKHRLEKQRSTDSKASLDSLRTPSEKVKVKKTEKRHGSRSPGRDSRRDRSPRDRRSSLSPEGSLRRRYSRDVRSSSRSPSRPRRSPSHDRRYRNRRGSRDTRSSSYNSSHLSDRRRRHRYRSPDSPRFQPRRRNTRDSRSPSHSPNYRRHRRSPSYSPRRQSGHRYSRDSRSFSRSPSRRSDSYRRSPVRSRRYSGRRASRTSRSSSRSPSPWSDAVRNRRSSVLSRSSSSSSDRRARSRPRSTSQERSRGGHSRNRRKSVRSSLEGRPSRSPTRHSKKCSDRRRSRSRSPLIQSSPVNPSRATEVSSSESVSPQDKGSVLASVITVPSGRTPFHPKRKHVVKGKSSPITENGSESEPCSFDGVIGEKEKLFENICHSVRKQTDLKAKTASHSSSPLKGVSKLRGSPVETKTLDDLDSERARLLLELDDLKNSDSDSASVVSHHSVTSNSSGHKRKSSAAVQRGIATDMADRVTSDSGQISSDNWSDVQSQNSSAPFSSQSPMKANSYDQETTFDGQSGFFIDKVSKNTRNSPQLQSTPSGARPDNQTAKAVGNHCNPEIVKPQIKAVAHTWGSMICNMQHEKQEIIRGETSVNMKRDNEIKCVPETLSKHVPDMFEIECKTALSQMEKLKRKHAGQRVQALHHSPMRAWLSLITSDTSRVYEDVLLELCRSINVSTTAIFSELHKSTRKTARKMAERLDTVISHMEGAHYWKFLPPSMSSMNSRNSSGNPQSIFEWLSVLVNPEAKYFRPIVEDITATVGALHFYKMSSLSAEQRTKIYNRVAFYQQLWEKLNTSTETAAPSTAVDEMVKTDDSDKKQNSDSVERNSLSLKCKPTKKVDHRSYRSKTSDQWNVKRCDSCGRYPDVLGLDFAVKTLKEVKSILHKATVYFKEYVCHMKVVLWNAKAFKAIRFNLDKSLGLLSSVNSLSAVIKENFCDLSAAYENVASVLRVSKYLYLKRRKVQIELVISQLVAAMKLVNSSIDSAVENQAKLVVPVITCGENYSSCPACYQHIHGSQQPMATLDFISLDTKPAKEDFAAAPRMYSPSRPTSEDSGSEIEEGEPTSFTAPKKTDCVPPYIVHIFSQLHSKLKNQRKDCTLKGTRQFEKISQRLLLPDEKKYGMLYGGRCIWLKRNLTKSSYHALIHFRSQVFRINGRIRQLNQPQKDVTLQQKAKRILMNKRWNTLNRFTDKLTNNLPQKLQARANKLKECLLWIDSEGYPEIVMYQTEEMRQSLEDQLERVESAVKLAEAGLDKMKIPSLAFLLNPEGAVSTARVSKKGLQVDTGLGREGMRSSLENVHPDPSATDLGTQDKVAVWAKGDRTGSKAYKIKYFTSNNTILEPSECTKDKIEPTNDDTRRALAAALVCKPAVEVQPTLVSSPRNDDTRRALAAGIGEPIMPIGKAQEEPPLRDVDMRVGTEPGRREALAQYPAEAVLQDRDEREAVIQDRDEREAALQDRDERTSSSQWTGLTEAWQGSPITSLSGQTRRQTYRSYRHSSSEFQSPGYSHETSVYNNLPAYNSYQVIPCEVQQQQPPPPPVYYNEPSYNNYVQPNNTCNWNYMPRNAVPGNLSNDNLAFAYTGGTDGTKSRELLTVEAGTMDNSIPAEPIGFVREPEVCCSRSNTVLSFEEEEQLMQNIWSPLKSTPVRVGLKTPVATSQPIQTTYSLQPDPIPDKDIKLVSCGSDCSSWLCNHQQQRGPKSRKCVRSGLKLKSSPKLEQKHRSDTRWGLKHRSGTRWGLKSASDKKREAKSTSLKNITLPSFVEDIHSQIPDSFQEEQISNSRDTSEVQPWHRPDATVHPGCCEGRQTLPMSSLQQPVHSEEKTAVPNRSEMFKICGPFLSKTDQFSDTPQMDNSTGEVRCQNVQIKEKVDPKAKAIETSEACATLNSAPKLIQQSKSEDCGPQVQQHVTGVRTSVPVPDKSRIGSASPSHVSDDHRFPEPESENQSEVHNSCLLLPSQIKVEPQSDASDNEMAQTNPQYDTTNVGYDHHATSESPQCDSAQGAGETRSYLHKSGVRNLDNSTVKEKPKNIFDEPSKYGSWHRPCGSPNSVHGNEVTESGIFKDKATPESCRQQKSCLRKSERIHVAQRKLRISKSCTDHSLCTSNSNKRQVRRKLKADVFPHKRSKDSPVMQELRVQTVKVESESEGITTANCGSCEMKEMQEANISHGTDGNKVLSQSINSMDITIASQDNESICQDRRTQQSRTDYDCVLTQSCISSKLDQPKFVVKKKRRPCPDKEVKVEKKLKKRESSHPKNITANINSSQLKTTYSSNTSSKLKPMQQATPETGCATSPVTPELCKSFGNVQEKLTVGGHCPAEVGPSTIKEEPQSGLNTTLCPSLSDIGQDGREQPSNGENSSLLLPSQIKTEPQIDRPDKYLPLYLESSSLTVATKLGNTPNEKLRSVCVKQEMDCVPEEQEEFKVHTEQQFDQYNIDIPQGRETWHRPYVLRRTRCNQDSVNENFQQDKVMEVSHVEKHLHLSKRTGGQLSDDLDVPMSREQGLCSRNASQQSRDVCETITSMAQPSKLKEENVTKADIPFKAVDSERSMKALDNNSEEAKLVNQQSRDVCETTTALAPPTTRKKEPVTKADIPFKAINSKRSLKVMDNNSQEAKLASQQCKPVCEMTTALARPTTRKKEPVTKADIPFKAINSKPSLKVMDNNSQEAKLASQQCKPVCETTTALARPTTRKKEPVTKADIPIKAINYKRSLKVMGDNSQEAKLAEPVIVRQKVSSKKSYLQACSSSDTLAPVPCNEQNFLPVPDCSSVKANPQSETIAAPDLGNHQQKPRSLIHTYKTAVNSESNEASEQGKSDQILITQSSNGPSYKTVQHKNIDKRMSAKASSLSTRRPKEQPHCESSCVSDTAFHGTESRKFKKNCSELTNKLTLGHQSGNQRREACKARNVCVLQTGELSIKMETSSEGNAPTESDWCQEEKAVFESQFVSDQERCASSPNQREAVVWKTREVCVSQMGKLVIKMETPSESSAPREFGRCPETKISEGENRGAAQINCMEAPDSKGNNKTSNSVTAFGFGDKQSKRPGSIKAGNINVKLGSHSDKYNSDVNSAMKSAHLQKTGKKTGIGQDNIPQDFELTRIEIDSGPTNTKTASKPGYTTSAVSPETNTFKKSGDRNNIGETLTPQPTVDKICQSERNSSKYIEMICTGNSKAAPSKKETQEIKGKFEEIETLDTVWRRSCSPQPDMEAESYQMNTSFEGDHCHQDVAEHDTTDQDDSWKNDSLQAYMLEDGAEYYMHELSDVRRILLPDEACVASEICGAQSDEYQMNMPPEPNLWHQDVAQHGRIDQEDQTPSPLCDSLEANMLDDEYSMHEISDVSRIPLPDEVCAASEICGAQSDEYQMNMPPEPDLWQQDVAQHSRIDQEDKTPSLCGSLEANMLGDEGEYNRHEISDVMPNEVCVASEIRGAQSDEYQMNLPPEQDLWQQDVAHHGRIDQENKTSSPLCGALKANMLGDEAEYNPHEISDVMPDEECVASETCSAPPSPGGELCTPVTSAQINYQWNNLTSCTGPGSNNSVDSETIIQGNLSIRTTSQVGSLARNTRTPVPGNTNSNTAKPYYNRPCNPGWNTTFQPGNHNWNNGKASHGNRNCNNGTMQPGNPNWNNCTGRFGNPNWNNGPEHPGNPNLNNCARGFGNNWKNGTAQPGNPNWNNGIAQPGNPNWNNGTAQPGNPNSNWNNCTGRFSNPNWNNRAAQPGNPNLNWNNCTGGFSNPNWNNGRAQPGNPNSNWNNCTGEFSNLNWNNGTTQPGNHNWNNRTAQPGNPNLNWNNSTGGFSNPNWNNDTAQPDNPNSNWNNCTEGFRNPNWNNGRAQPDNPNWNDCTEGFSSPNWNNGTAQPGNPNSNWNNCTGGFINPNWNNGTTQPFNPNWNNRTAQPGNPNPNWNNCTGGFINPNWNNGRAQPDNPNWNDCTEGFSSPNWNNGTAQPGNPNSNWNNCTGGFINPNWNNGTTQPFNPNWNNRTAQPGNPNPNWNNCTGGFINPNWNNGRAQPDNPNWNNCMEGFSSPNWNNGRAQPDNPNWNNCTEGFSNPNWNNGRAQPDNPNWNHCTEGFSSPNWNNGRAQPDNPNWNNCTEGFSSPNWNNGRAQPGNPNSNWNDCTGGFINPNWNNRAAQPGNPNSNWNNCTGGFSNPNWNNRAAQPGNSNWNNCTGGFINPNWNNGTTQPFNPNWNNRTAQPGNPNLNWNNCTGGFINWNNAQVIVPLRWPPFQSM